MLRVRCACRRLEAYRCLDAATIPSVDDDAAQAIRRFEDAVEAFDRGACAEEATFELTPDLGDALPDGAVKDAVCAALRHLAADPPRGNREAVVRKAHAALQRLR
jgi:hypothetical protein